MNKNLFFILVALSFLSVVNAQDFKIVQVTLENGQTFKGKKGILTDESISFRSGTDQKTVPLSEVSLVQAKKGRAGKLALAMGGGCFGICVISIAATGGEVTSVDASGNSTTVTYPMGQLMAGTIIWTGIFAGIGALIGGASDHWQNVFISKKSSFLNNVNLNIGPNKYAKVNIGFTYRF